MSAPFAGARGSRARAPRDIPARPGASDPAPQHEEHVAQAVEEPERPLADWLLPRQRQELALGPAAHRARLMQKAVDAAAARQHEGLERRQILLAAVHQRLEL